MSDDHDAGGFGARRRFLAAAAGAAVSATMPSLAAPDLESEIGARARALAGARPTPLRLLAPEGCRANIVPVIAHFHEMTGVDVTLIETGVDDIAATLAYASLSGQADYDLALPATFSLPDLVAAGAIRPLTAYAARHESAGFRDGILYDVGDSFDGELYGFQTDGDAYLMFYHRGLLEDADERARYADLHGEALDVPATWEELDRQMAFFHRPERGLFGGALFRSTGYLAWEWWVRFHAKGVWPLSAAFAPQIDSDAGVEALEQMIRASAHLVPEARVFELFENWKRYAQGDVYCNIGWGGTQKYLNGPLSAMRGRMVHGPTPGGIVDGRLLRTPYFNWGWDYVVTADSTRPELAYLFAMFTSTPAMSTLSVAQSGGFFDPFRPEHYADARIREVYGEEFLAVHEASLRQAVPDLYLANRGEYFRLLGDWLDRAIDGRVDPAAALANVARGWEALDARTSHERQSERWQALRAKYPPHVAARLRDLT